MEIQHKCKQCHHEWHVHGSSMTLGGEPQGCPGCGYNPVLEKRQNDQANAFAKEMDKLRTELRVLDES